MKLTKKALIVATVAVMSVGSGVILAQEDGARQLTDDESVYMIQDCSVIKNRLKQLHARDALTRSRSGQLYETVSSKLTSQMNGRLASNRIDASELLKIAAIYDVTLKEFRQKYIDYDESFEAMLKVNCQSDPQAFFNLANKADFLRNQVKNKAIKLNDLLKSYRSELKKIQIKVGKQDD